MVINKIFRILRKEVGLKRFFFNKVPFNVYVKVLSALFFVVVVFFLLLFLLIRTFYFFIFVLLCLIDICFKGTNNRITIPTTSTTGEERFIHGKSPQTWPGHYLSETK